MEFVYASVTIQIPTGYYIRYLGAMAVASAKFQGMRISQGKVSRMQVTGIPHSEQLKEVADWAATHLPEF